MHKRIKEEREKLGYTQKELAEIAGIKVLSQSNYERGVTEPKASYFALLFSLGADIFYILTGTPFVGELYSTNEKLLLEKFREADSHTQKSVFTLLLFNDKPQPIKESNKVFESVTNYVEHNAGDVAHTIYKNEVKDE